MQLSTLRHRGAFTTVSQTFAVCCQQSKNLESRGSTGTLVMAWYNVSFTRQSGNEPLTVPVAKEESGLC